MEVEEVRILDPIKNCAKVMIFQLLAALDHVGNLTVSLNLPSLRRAQGLLECGVDGIEVYESELQALCTIQRWLLPLFGNLKCLKDFLKNSNLEACYPVRASTAAFGHDNHSAWDTSTWRNWNVYGNESNSL